MYVLLWFVLHTVTDMFNSEIYGYSGLINTSIYSKSSSGNLDFFVIIMPIIYLFI